MLVKSETRPPWLSLLEAPSTGVGCMHRGETRVLGFSGAEIGETVKWQMEEGRGNHESGLYGSDKGSQSKAGRLRQ